MGTTLTLCEGCARHVKSDAARCPFCDAEVIAPELRELPSGLSRRALMALGASFVVEACRSSGRSDDSSIVQPYGAPIQRFPDVQRVATDATSATPEVPLIVAPYGAPPDPRPAAPNEITWELAATATTLRMRDRASWRLRVLATNRSNEPVDPSRGVLSFAVNGSDSQVADMAFNNGARGHEWMELAPGATATDEREIGTALLPRPGDYHITLRIGGADVSTLIVRVTR